MGRSKLKKLDFFRDSDFMLIIMLRRAQDIFTERCTLMCFIFLFFIFRIQRCFSYDSSKQQNGSTDLTALDEYSV